MKLFHGTSTNLEGQIRSEGLKPHMTGSADAWAKKNGWTIQTNNSNRPAAVYLTANKELAQIYASRAVDVHSGNPVVLEVNIPDGITLLDDEDDTNGKKFEGSIPSNWIR